MSEATTTILEPPSLPASAAPPLRNVTFSATTKTVNYELDANAFPRREHTSAIPQGSKIAFDFTGHGIMRNQHRNLTWFSELPCSGRAVAEGGALGTEAAEITVRWYNFDWEPINAAPSPLADSPLVASCWPILRKMVLGHHAHTDWQRLVKHLDRHGSEFGLPRLLNYDASQNEYLTVCLEGRYNLSLMECVASVWPIGDANQLISYKALVAFMRSTLFQLYEIHCNRGLCHLNLTLDSIYTVEVSQAKRTAKSEVVQKVGSTDNTQVTTILEHWGLSRELPERMPPVPPAGNRGGAGVVCEISPAESADSGEVGNSGLPAGLAAPVPPQRSRRRMSSSAHSTSGVSTATTMLPRPSEHPNSSEPNNNTNNNNHTLVDSSSRQEAPPRSVRPTTFFAHTRNMDPNRLPNLDDSAEEDAWWWLSTAVIPPAALLAPEFSDPDSQKQIKARQQQAQRYLMRKENLLPQSPPTDHVEDDRERFQRTERRHLDDNDGGERQGPSGTYEHQGPANSNNDDDTTAWNQFGDAVPTSISLLAATTTVPSDEQLVEMRQRFLSDDELNQKLTTATDVWCLGRLFFQMITKQLDPTFVPDYQRINETLDGLYNRHNPNTSYKFAKSKELENLKKFFKRALDPDPLNRFSAQSLLSMSMFSSGISPSASMVDEYSACGGNSSTNFTISWAQSQSSKRGQINRVHLTVGLQESDEGNKIREQIRAGKQDKRQQSTRTRPAPLGQDLRVQARTTEIPENKFLLEAFRRDRRDADHEQVDNIKINPTANEPSADKGEPTKDHLPAFATLPPQRSPPPTTVQMPTASTTAPAKENVVSHRRSSSSSGAGGGGEGAAGTQAVSHRRTSKQMTQRNNADNALGLSNFELTPPANISPPDSKCQSGDGDNWERVKPPRHVKQDDRSQLARSLGKAASASDTLQQDDEDGGAQRSNLSPLRRKSKGRTAIQAVGCAVIVLVLLCFVGVFVTCMLGHCLVGGSGNNDNGPSGAHEPTTAVPMPPQRFN